MTFPILEFDPDRFAALSPERFHQPRADMPAAGVLCFFQDVIDHLLGAGLLTEIASLKSELGKHPIYRFATPAGDVALLHPGIGAPFAAGCMEELAALGVRTFVACGGAGVLERDIAVGALLVPTAAVRDEGTSYHYLPPDRELAFDPAAIAGIEAALRARAVPYRAVKTWTTDAFYRETPARIARRRAEGCACVEMEAAALCAVARFRGLRFGQLLYGGDDVGGLTWDGRGWNRQWSVREKLTQLAAEVALALGPPPPPVPVPAPPSAPKPPAADVRLRPAVAADLEAINAIYNHYVLHATCTYQEEPDTLEQRRAWFAQHDAAHPVIVAEVGGRVVGWGSLSRFRERSAYRHTVEDSVYVADGWHARGIGTALLRDLVARARDLGHHAIVAGIDAEQTASLALHARLGFAPAGRLNEVGRKFDRWLDVVYMVLPLTGRESA